jgi:hypothetical protein
MAKLFKIFVELYDLIITARKDDRSGRVVSTGSVKIDGLVEVASKRRTDISPAVMKASYVLLREAALEEFCNGKSVEFGLVYNQLGTNGIFIGDHPGWDPKKNSLALFAVATAETREAMKNIEVEVLGMASSGLYVNTLTDVTSDKVNTCITPGGGVNLTGTKIRIAGDSPEVGICLTEVNTDVVTTIPMTSILVNEPSKVTFIVPADLPAGDYKLSIITQYNPNILLKEPRTYVFDYVLACN